MIVLQILTALFMAWITGHTIATLAKPFLPKSPLEKLQLEINDLEAKINIFGNDAPKNV